MSARKREDPFLPPRWIIRVIWYAHRALYKVTRGRLGTKSAESGDYGTMRLTTIGRRTGAQRSVMVCYFEDGPDLVTLAMNGWGEGEPAWWLNLQADPYVAVDMPEGRRTVRGRAADGEERSRLWARWREIDRDLDRYAALRSGETAVVVLEPTDQRVDAQK